MKYKVLFLVLLTVFFVNAVVYSNSPAQSGETLDFKIRYGIIVGGKVVFKTDKKEINNKSVFHTSVTAKTTGLIDQLYNLYDVYESYYDIETGLPELFVQDVNEGKYHFFDEVKFNQKKKYATSLKKDTTIHFDRGTYDIISAIYNLRKKDWSQLKINDVVEINTLHESKLFPMYVVYKGKERISIGSSAYECHRFAPVIDSGKIFQKKENMVMWFSDDENKIPVAIKFNLKVGSFRLELEKYENLAHSFNAKVK